MERAGTAVVKHITSNYLRQPTTVICGPGKNGGDGYVVARQLQKQGWPVKVVAAPGEETTYGERTWIGEKRPFEADSIDENCLVVDALFGTGLTRALTGEFLEIVERVNKVANHIISIDIPSGIHSDSGDVLGTAVKASTTVTFNVRKPGHILLPGKTFAGHILIKDIGIVCPPSQECQIFVNHPVFWIKQIPTPEHHTHKYSRGTLQVYGGPDTIGASLLATQAARRLGAGYVSLWCDPKVKDNYQGFTPGLVVREFQKPEEFIDQYDHSSFLVGPGAGQSDFVQDLVLKILKTGRPCVLDADALSVFKSSPEKLHKSLHDKCIITPHQGEFERIFDISGGKIDRTQKAAQMTGAIVLFKGADTVISDPTGKTHVQDDSTPRLATAGTGDVLAGMIASLLSQGMPPMEAASCSVWLHSQAAKAFGVGLIAEDIPDLIPEILRKLRTRD